MAKPYSMDLRKRAVAAVVRGGLSRRKAAAQFGLGASTVIRWVRRLQETGSAAPGQMGGHKPKAIRGEHESWLRQRIQQADFTLRGLVAELAERGLTVDYRSVWNFVHAATLSFKKNRAGQRAGSPRRGAPARAMDQASGPGRGRAPGFH
jgi:putative transposase